MTNDDRNSAPLVNLQDKSEFEYYQNVLKKEYTVMNEKLHNKGCGIKNILITFGEGDREGEPDVEIVSILCNIHPEVMEGVIEETLRVLNESEEGGNFTPFKSVEKATND